MWIMEPIKTTQPRKTNMNTVNIETVNEPTLRFQLFTRTTSKRHIEAGAPYRLHYSADTMEHMLEMVKDEINMELETIMIVDTEAME